jgi:predicted ArsR family transcriptional regulator
MKSAATVSSSAAQASSGQSAASWTFLTNHGHVLICLAIDPALRLRDIATHVGITERAAQRILHDLVESGYVERRRSGRRNEYRLRLERPMRHPIEAGHAVRELVSVLAGGAAVTAAKGTGRDEPPPD